jgi:FeS assembly protein IscX
MRWVDVYEIAAALEEQYPEADIAHLRFTDLRKFVLDLHGFDGDPAHCGEKILEAIQAAWLDEREG